MQLALASKMLSQPIEAVALACIELSKRAESAALILLYHLFERRNNNYELDFGADFCTLCHLTQKRRSGIAPARKAAQRFEYRGLNMV